MENNRGYDKFIDQETGEVATAAPVVTVVKATAKSQLVLNDIKEIKDTGQKAIGALMNQVNSYALNRGRELNEYQKSVLSNNLQGLEMYREKNKLEYKNMDFKGNNIYGTMLAYASQGLDIIDKDFSIIGYYSTSEKRYVMRMSLQYQGEQKLLSKYVRINGQMIHHYFEHVIYANDTFETEFDFENGEEKIISYKPNKNNSKEYKKELNNIVGAFASAYLPNGQGGFTKIQKLISKDRINEAHKFSKTETFWGKFPGRMALKTAYHDLYKSMRSFIDPSILKSEDMETINPINKERKFDNSIDVETNVKDEACNKKLGCDF